MTTIQLTAQIAAPPTKVYDYVSRPARWKDWHPASLGTPGHGDESLAAGATFAEEVRSAGFKRHLRWQVKESQPGQLWEAHAVMNDGSTVRLRYEFQKTEAGTDFKRTLTYEIRPRLLRLANDLFMWRRVRRESERALAALVARFPS